MKLSVLQIQWTREAAGVKDQFKEAENKRKEYNNAMLFTWYQEFKGQKSFRKKEATTLSETRADNLGQDVRGTRLD